MIKLKLMACVLSLAVLLGAAPVFEITNGQALKISKQGTPFLLVERTTPAVQLSEMQRGKGADGSMVYNAFKRDGQLPFRREASLSANGKMVEITFQGITHAYDPQPKVIGYSLDFDIKEFAGGTYYAVSGRTSRPVEHHGKIPEVGTPAFARSMRFGPGSGRVLILTTADQKKSLVFDFNVEGVTTYSDYGANVVRGVWNMSVQKGILTCGVGFNQRTWGGIVNSLLRVYEGTKETWLQNHAMTKYAYAVPIPCQGSYSFGAPAQKVGNGFKKISALYTKENKAGWLNAVPPVKSIAPSGSLYTASYSNKPGVFQVSGLKPGIYLLTMRNAAYDKPVGKFSVTVNGKEFVKNAKLPANHVSVIRRFVHMDETTKFEFTGDWSLSTLAFQAVFTDFEDIRFNRGFWKLVGQWEPTPFLASKDQARPIPYKTDIDLIPIVPHDYQVPADFKLVLKRESCRPADSDELEWRYNSNITGLGPSNDGCFLEFNTPEKISRRMDELKREGTTTILINGLLARHLAPTLTPYLDKYIGAYADEAHKRGMKLLDHQDYPLLWGINDGVLVAVDKPNLILQSLKDSSGLLSYCITQDDYLKAYRKEIVRQVKERHLDGLMVDEVSFIGGEDYCGCASCRKKFTQDTGLILPMDETSPLFGKDNILRRAFDQWRMKMVGDWFVGLRKEINKIQPNFCLMLYTTHYGWYSDYASVKRGGTLEDPARAVDFLGTEIMSRNVIVSRRPVYAFRKMKNSLANVSKTPIFGLVYPQDNYNISEFGWGLNNLANQSTWFIGTVPENKTGVPFISFPFPYNRRFCKPAGRIAVLWSTRCRDYARNTSYYAEPLGMGELLNDLGIQYEYILESGLNDLKDYTALMVLNAHNLSDQQVAQIRSFAEKGGLVYLSINAGTYTELAEPRQKWPFADIFNGTVRLPVKFDKLDNYDGALGTIPQQFMSTAFAPLPGVLKGEVLWSARGGKYPVTVKVPYGKGTFIYNAMSLGYYLKEDEKTVNEPFLGMGNPVLLPIAQKLLQQELMPHSALRYLKPATEYGLFSGLYIEQKPGQKGRLVLHLLNGYGIQNPALKAKIPNRHPLGTWTPLPTAVQFEVVLSAEQAARVGNLTKATCYAPEYQGGKAAEWKKTGENRWLLTVPADAVPRYTAVMIE